MLKNSTFVENKNRLLEKVGNDRMEIKIDTTHLEILKEIEMEKKL